MFGTTFFGKYQVEARAIPRAVRRNKNATVFFLFLTSATFFSVSIVRRYTSAPSISLTRVFEARRSLLLHQCIRKGQTANCDNDSNNGCRRRREDIFPPLRHLKYIQNLPGDLVFCVPLKAGSSSLNNYIYTNVDAADFQTWYNETKKKTIGDKYVEEMLDQGGTTRVMVIRHPFHRLVSAFHYIFRASVNLEPIFIEQAATSWLAGRIIKQLRPHSTDPLISFPEFVDYVLDTEGKFTDLKAEEVARWSWGSSPVGISDHWQPFSTFCSPCRLLPQIILELETLKEELPFVLEWSGLSRVYGQFSPLPRANAAVVGNAKSVARELFGQLTKKQIDGLLEYYKDDFNIGGYNIHL